MVVCGRGGLELPGQPRPGAAVHRPRPGRAAARHRGQDGHHRAHRLRHRHRSHLGRIHAKHNEGRRNRHQIQAHLPLPQTGSREHTIGETLALLTGADDEATAVRRPGQASSMAYMSQPWMPFGAGLVYPRPGSAPRSRGRTTDKRSIGLTAFRRSGLRPGLPRGRRRISPGERRTNR